MLEKLLLSIGVYNYEYQSIALYALREYNSVFKYNKDWYILQHKNSKQQGNILIPLQPYYDPSMLDLLDIVRIQIPEIWVSKFPEAKIWPDRFDHIFDIHKLAKYEGSEFSGCRNEFNRFYRDNPNMKIEEIKSDNIHDVWKILYRWERDYINSDETWDEETDYDDNCFMLGMYDILELYGFIFYIDNEPVGYCFGYFEDEYFFCPAFKCQRIYGLHPTMMKYLCNSIEQNYSKINYMNFTEDGGDLGLRASKMKYRPIKFLQRYYIDCY